MAELETGKVDDFTESERKELYDTIGLGALKFFLLRVDPKKRMVFNPDESIDFHGFTGPFVQYTYARIKSILRKEGLTDNFDSLKAGNAGTAETGTGAGAKPTTLAGTAAGADGTRERDE